MITPTIRKGFEVASDPGDPAVEAFALPSYLGNLKRISIGGMGAVYEAIDLTTGRKLAVKALLPEFLNDEIKRKRFMREAEAIASLSSNHIVRIYDFGVSATNAPYMVMEHIDGTTLDEELENGAMNESELVEVFRQIADGLDHAHAVGVLHRDLKPSNIMIVRTGTRVVVKLIDFGIAKFFSGRARGQEPLTEAGDIVGTPLFMSPEQWLNEGLDARSDIYSLGCVMYYCFTGNLPHDGASISEIFSKHFHTRPDLSSLTASIRPVVARCLEKDPDERYGAMPELAKDLDWTQAAGRLMPRLSGAQKAALRRIIAFLTWLMAGFALTHALLTQLSF